MALQYLSGFGNHHSSETLDNSLPKRGNSPQKVPYGLYTEQLSGTAFTVARANNRRSWLYRIQPSLCISEFTSFSKSQDTRLESASPNPLRWNPLSYPKEKKDFIEGLTPWCQHADLTCGAALYLYAINQSMGNRFFYNAQGEMLIVPQEGGLRFDTEFGSLEISPGEIIVIPQGIKFQVHILNDKARGYVCENFGNSFTLPELGPIGANGLANARDFYAPSARFYHTKDTFELIAKFENQLWQAQMDHHPLDVVAWHGNYYPYKYDLSSFNTINTVSFDHVDPSIFTVLTAPSSQPGVANVDFVIFPERWMVAEDTFRPPYFHRNIMSEFMGLIKGCYDAKTSFQPGGCTLHNCMTAHGPDNFSYEKAISQALKPEYYHGTLAFMFESQQIWQPTHGALQSSTLDKNYKACWEGLKDGFRPKS